MPCLVRQRCKGQRTGDAEMYTAAIRAVPAVSDFFSGIFAGRFRGSAPGANVRRGPPVHRSVAPLLRCTRRSHHPVRHASVCPRGPAAPGPRARAAGRARRTGRAARLRPCRQLPHRDGRQPVRLARRQARRLHGDDGEGGGEPPPQRGLGRPDRRWSAGALHAPEHGELQPALLAGRAPPAVHVAAAGRQGEHVGAPPGRAGGRGLPAAEHAPRQRELDARRRRRRLGRHGRRDRRRPATRRAPRIRSRACRIARSPYGAITRPVDPDALRRPARRRLPVQEQRPRLRARTAPRRGGGAPRSSTCRRSATRRSGS